MSSATRALRILHEILAAEAPPTRKELLQAVDMPSSTLSTVAGELRELGFVATVDGRYVPGPALLAMAFQVTHAVGAEGLRTGVRPALERLVDATGETVTFSIEVGRTAAHLGHVLAVDHVPSPNPIRYVPGIGRLQPLHRSAAGRVFLAFTARSARDVPAEAFVKTTQRTVVDPAELDAVLEQVRRRGFALNVDETIEGVTAVAAPIRDADDMPVAAITVLGPTQRLDDPARTIWPLLREEIRALEARGIEWLGGSGAQRRTA